MSCAPIRIRSSSRGKVPYFTVQNVVSMQRTKTGNSKQMRYMRTISPRIILRDMRLGTLSEKDAITADSEAFSGDE